MIVSVLKDSQRPLNSTTDRQLMILLGDSGAQGKGVRSLEDASEEDCRLLPLSLLPDS